MKTLDTAPYVRGGEQTYHRLTWGGQLRCTGGVKRLADDLDAWWLLTDIAAYQHDPAVQALWMQFWRLTVRDVGNGWGRGELVCLPDKGQPPVFRQEITCTNFPAPGVELWAAEGVL